MKIYKSIKSYKSLYKWYKSPIGECVHLDIGLSWSRTPQGNPYWHNIYKKCFYNNINQDELKQAQKNIKELLFQYWTRGA